MFRNRISELSQVGLLLSSLLTIPPPSASNYATPCLLRLILLTP